jgi:hypothetical protein
MPWGVGKLAIERANKALLGLVQLHAKGNLVLAGAILKCCFEFHVGSP